ncbi:MAG: formylglycine-generating enzyme family protein, partial [Microcystis sp.]
EKRPNPWGIYDMHGNVWEWCADSYHESYARKPDNIKENASIPWYGGYINTKQLLRGGACDSYPGLCRSAYRGDSDVLGYGHGFRVVCDLP